MWVGVSGRTVRPETDHYLWCIRSHSVCSWNRITLTASYPLIPMKKHRSLDDAFMSGRRCLRYRTKTGSRRLKLRRGVRDMSYKKFDQADLEVIKNIIKDDERILYAENMGPKNTVMMKIGETKLPRCCNESDFCKRNL